MTEGLLYVIRSGRGFGMAGAGTIDPDSAAANLIVAWRTGRNAHGGVVKMAGDVTATLRGYAKDAMAIIGGGGGRAYNPDDDQEDDCPFLEADAGELLDTPLLEILRRGASLPQVGPDDVRRRQVALYAVLIGNDPDSRLTFVRKGSPVQLARRGLVAVLDSSLTRVTRPILAFDPVFDVVIHGTKVWILGQKRFEGLFRESAAVLVERHPGC